MSVHTTSYSNRILTEDQIESLNDSEDYDLGGKYNVDYDLVSLYLNSLSSHGIVNSDIFEMELRFNQFKREYGGVANTLNKQQFNDIISLFGNKQNELDIRGSAVPQYSLDITFHSNNYVDLSDDLSKLRFTIVGKSKIGEFCRNNRLDLKDPSTSVIYKGIRDKFESVLKRYLKEAS